MKVNQEYEKLKNNVIRIVIIAVVTIGLLFTVLYSLATFTDRSADASDQIERIPIGMELDKLKSRVAAYQPLRDNNISLAGEHFGYRDDVYSAGYTLGGSSLVEVHLTDETSFVVHDIVVFAYAGSDDAIDRLTFYLLAFNKALTGEEYVDEISEMLLSAVDHGFQGISLDLSDIHLTIEAVEGDDGTPYIALHYERYK